MRKSFFTVMFCTLLGMLTIQQSKGAQDFSQKFQEANKLYEQGKYPEAIREYVALTTNISSPAVFYNLGNTYFKAGQSGQALASLRQAQALAPRDPEIKANLKYIREQVGNPAVSSPKALLQSLGISELAIISSLALWIWLALLISGQLKPNLKPALRPYSLMAGLAFGISAGWLFSVLYMARASREAVVVVKEAVVRYGPLEESQSAFTLRDGAEVSLLQTQNGWLQIRDARKGVGWVLAKNVVVPNAF